MCKTSFASTEAHGSACHASICMLKFLAKNLKIHCIKNSNQLYNGELGRVSRF